MEIGVSGEIAKTVRCLMIREQEQGILATEHVALGCRGEGEWQTESHPGAVQALNCQCLPSRDLGREHLRVFALCCLSAPLVIVNPQPEMSGIKNLGDLARSVRSNKASKYIWVVDIYVSGALNRSVNY